MNSLLSNKNGSFEIESTTTLAKLSLGIAFRKLPPLIEAICKPKLSKPSNNKRFIILFAFPNPL
mgnify:CR=1 FL=1